MRRRWIWAILVIALLMVTACRPTTEEISSEGSEEGASEVLGVCQPEEDCDDETTEGEEPTEEPAEATATPEVEPRTEEVENVPVEEPVDLGDDPLAVTDADWVKGPDDAFITIIEYGDFQ